MFACLYSLSAPVAALVKIAEDFTPRFEVMGPLVMLDLSGLSRLFGSPQDIGEQLRRSASGPVRIALAPTQTAAALLAIGRPGLTVVMPGDQPDTLASLPVSLLGDLDRLRLTGGATQASPPLRSLAVSLQPSATLTDPPPPPQVGAMGDALPYFMSSLDRTSEIAIKAHCGGGCGGGGWKHPRDSHAASQTRRPRRAITATRDTEHPQAAPGTALSVHTALGTGTSVHPAPGTRPAYARGQNSGELRRGPAVAAAGGGGGHPAPDDAHPAPRTPHSHSAPRTLHSHSALTEIQALLDTLRRWGIKTLGALAALPPGDVYERLGAHGVRWQRVSQGEDLSPLVPWVPEDPFEAALGLEWPIEGLEPLSFVLGRLLEPLVERLERADRGAAVLHTYLRLVSKAVHARTLQLPAPMRDPKTLRTLVLLDLESNPPSAAIDQVRLLIDPTPGRVTQWRLFERAQPSPEHVSTLLARLTALMGETHVGSPRLVDSWRPGLFTMAPFQVRRAECGVRRASTEWGVRSAGAECDAPPALRIPHSDSALGTPHSHSHSHSALRTPHSDSALRTPHSALRRFRLPVPARVQVQEGRPVRVMTDRRGVTGGAIVQAAGPWRTSGEWWNDAPVALCAVRLADARSRQAVRLADARSRQAAPVHPCTAPHPSHPTCWDRDEWDVAIADGTVYRLYVEREVGQWYLEGVVD